MKKVIVTSLISLIIVVVGPDLYADGNTRKKEKSAVKATSEKLMEKVAIAMDTELSFESWMKEISSFEAEESILEETLSIENWMTNIEAFEIEAAFVEADLAMENWMMEVFDIEFSESALELESWMLHPFETKENFQEDELQLESWMYRF